MKSLIFTNEYPPHIYGGAGVHVEYLCRELSKLIEVEVRCFGDQKVIQPHLRATGFPVDKSKYSCPENLKSLFGALQRCLDFQTLKWEADVVHCHTWYTHMAGIWAKLTRGVPLVLTVHSLEPLRPWKREQLGAGYEFSTWVEKTALEMADAVIAVSQETANDLHQLFAIPEDKVHIIYNGIDLHEYRRVEEKAVLKRFGISPTQPYILFVGRIARQKGLRHLVNAIKYLDAGFQVVLCAGAPDTPEIHAEMRTAVTRAQAAREGIVWIEEMLDVKSKIELYSHAGVFVCPSIYEPFGIINLEAMACGTPVVASGVGGIKEVVVHGETGYLVNLEQSKESPFEAVHPDQFARDLAARINELMADPAKRDRMGKAGRQRAENVFSWEAIARQTVDLYRSVAHG